MAKTGWMLFSAGPKTSDRRQENTMRTIEGNGVVIHDYTDKELAKPTAADLQRAIDEMDAAVAEGRAVWTGDARTWLQPAEREAA